MGDKANLDYQLMLSVALGQVDRVHQLLLSGANVNVIDEQGFTPLFNAIAYDHPGIAKLLLEKGADISFKNYVGQSYLDYASAFDRVWIKTL